MADAVRIEGRGLAEMQKVFRQLGPDYVKALKDTNADVAEEVAEGAMGRLKRGNNLARKLAGERGRGGGPIRGRGQQRQAVVQLGGKRPDLFRTTQGLEWGSLRDRYKGPKLFGSWVGNQYTPTRSPGRFVGVEVDEGDYLEIYLDAIDDLLDRLWPKGRAKPTSVADLGRLRGA